jgi:hypothetical protein
VAGAALVVVELEDELALEQPAAKIPTVMVTAIRMFRETLRR